MPGKGEHYNLAERTELNGADALERARGYRAPPFLGPRVSFQLRVPERCGSREEARRRHDSLSRRGEKRKGGHGRDHGGWVAGERVNYVILSSKVGRARNRQGILVQRPC